MQLSMRIVENWIQKYNPVATIISQEPTITGIRLFSYEKTPNPDYLYIGRTKDFFERSQSDEVLLVHRKDVISLSTYELEDVFDSLMDAFAFYQSWEQQMFSAFQKPNPEQVIVDACGTVFGPMFFSNMSLQITAFSRTYPHGSINRNWDDFLNLGTLSIESLNLIQNGNFLKNLSRKWNCEIFYEEPVEHYPYSMMISQENSAGQLTGQLTIISEAPFAEYQKHLAVFLKRALCFVAAHDAADQCTVAQNLFLEFLGDTQKEDSSTRLFYHLQGWNPEKSYVVAVLKRHPDNHTVMTYYLDVLRSKNTSAVFIPSPDSPEEEIVCGLPAEHPGSNTCSPDHHVIPDIYAQLFSHLNLSCYASFPFLGVSCLHHQYLQARLACSRNQPSFYQCALQILTSVHADADSRYYALHPALHLIRLYDRQKHTQFYEILKTYLRFERNRVQTAQKLYVHKNTLVYRLEKIEQLFRLNLDDPYEREYLLLSYRYLDSFELS